MVLAHCRKRGFTGVYNLLTPASHRISRQLTVNYTDSASGKLYAKRYGILLESRT